MILVAGMCVALSLPLAQEPEPVPVRLEAGEHERENVPIRVLVPASRFGDIAPPSIVITEAHSNRGHSEPVEVAVHRTEDSEMWECSWIQPRLPRGTTKHWISVQTRIRRGMRMPFITELFQKDGERDLEVADRPVLRYMHAFDTDRREETYKVYHHILDTTGEHVLTKGPGGMHGHHRGVFLGWNKTRHGEDTHDFWSCGGGETIRHRKHLDLDAPLSAPITNAQGAEIEWVTAGGKALVAERRVARAWRIDEGMHLFDFEVELRALDGPVHLGGNAHHAGFHVRLDQGHTEDEEPAIDYLRPETAEDLGNDVWQGCDWVAAGFPMHGGDHVLVHMDAPDNPRPIRYSTRPYGRFGSTFQTDLDEEPLRLRYRIALIDPDVHGTPDRALCERLYRDFAEPVKATVVE